ncbi:GNAT family N-acetyltransferase [Bremerella cremea]|nr:GNAT family N-acetyltransferase [Bremerella cremea]
MPIVDAVVACPVHDSFRVQAVAGMFDVPLAEKTSRQFSVELPSADQAWQVGMIVGESGSGKSTVAQAAYGNQLVRSFRWPREAALVDGFPSRLTAREVVRTLTSVGLSSPPTWCKPYHVLSTGEKFRADLARSIVRGQPVVAFDEYSSVVDRETARFGSLALRKGIERGQIGCQFVAVTCHQDVIPWLRPDWVLDMNRGELTWRCLRQPRLDLRIYAASRDAWPLFAPHHYLDGQLNPCARCFVGMLEDQPAALVAVLNHFHRKRFRISRLVTLPSFQGVGVGSAMLDGVAQLLADDGAELITISGSHPAIVAHANRSPQWQFSKLLKTGRKGSGMFQDQWKTSQGRAVATFRWIGSPESTFANRNHLPQ